MSISINEQDIAVSNYLREQDINYDVIYISNKEHDKEWQCDEWLVKFNNESFTFKTGLGHRIPFSAKGVYNYMRFDTTTGRQLKKLKEVIGLKSRDSATIKVKDDLKNSIFAVKPTQASVLYCLLLDSQAYNESFDSWCDNYGYDTDSTKDFNIYRACCNIAKQLNKVFTYEQQIKLKALLENY